MSSIAPTLPITYIPTENSQVSPKPSTLQKITKIAYEAIKAFVNLIFFPVRYVGTKFGLNYQFFNRDILPKQELLKKMDLVCSSAFAHSSDRKWIEPFGYEVISPKSFSISNKAIEKKDNCFFDSKTGLKAIVVMKKDQVIVSFGPLRSHLSELSDPKQNKTLFKRMQRTSAANLVGIKPKCFAEADQLFSDLLKDPRLKDKNITITGQCFGGSVASYVALKHQKKAFCVNALHLGAGLQQNIGRKKLKNAKNLVTHLAIRSDWLTDMTSFAAFDIFSSLILLKSPGRFGKKFVIPSAYKSRGKSHDFAVGSCMKYLGHDIRATPSDLINDPQTGA